MTDSPAPRQPDLNVVTGSYQRLLTERTHDAIVLAGQLAAAEQELVHANLHILSLEARLAHLEAQGSDIAEIVPDEAPAAA